MNGTKVFPDDTYLDVHTGDTVLWTAGGGFPRVTSLVHDKKSTKVKHGFIYEGAPSDKVKIELWETTPSAPTPCRARRRCRPPTPMPSSTT